MKLISKFGEAEVYQDESGLLYMCINRDLVPFSLLYRALNDDLPEACQSHPCTLRRAFDAMDMPMVDHRSSLGGQSL